MQHGAEQKTTIGGACERRKGIERRGEGGGGGTLRRNRRRTISIAVWPFRPGESLERQSTSKSCSLIKYSMNSTCDDSSSRRTA